MDARLLGSRAVRLEATCEKGVRSQGVDWSGSLATAGMEQGLSGLLLYHAYSKFYSLLSQIHNYYAVKSQRLTATLFIRTCEFG